MQLCSASGPALRLAGGAFLVLIALMDPYSALRVPADPGQPMPFCWVLRKKDQGPSVLTATQQRSRMRRNVTGSLRRQWRRAFRDGEAERLAVLSLITSSIMVACCTGRSAGFCAVASIASRAPTV